MAPNVVRSLLARHPFIPFDVCLSLGEVVSIEQPEQAWMDPEGTTLYVLDQPGRDSTLLIDLSLVEQISVRDRLRKPRGPRTL